MVLVQKLPVPVQLTGLMPSHESRDVAADNRQHDAAHKDGLESGHRLHPMRYPTLMPIPSPITQNIIVHQINASPLMAAILSAKATAG